MTEGVRKCPECGMALESNYRGTLIVWECPKLHGIGVNIFDAVGYLQRDEIDAIWQGSAGAPLSHLPSPINGKPMVAVKFIADDDIDYDNTGANAREMEVELDPENYFAWFTVEELNSMPTMENVEVADSSATIVGLNQLDAGGAEYEHYFEDIQDYGPESSGTSLVNMLGGLARRLARR